MIYLDNAATTALSPTALQRMMEVAQENYGNPSSIHQSGRKPINLLDKVVKRLLRFSPPLLNKLFSHLEAPKLIL